MPGGCLVSSVSDLVAHLFRDWVIFPYGIGLAFELLERNVLFLGG